MRKNISALLALILLLTLISCAPQGENTAAVTSDSPAEQTVQTDAPVTAAPQTERQTETDAQTERIPEETRRISFLAMGDNLIHSPIYRQSDIGGGEYDFLPKYEAVAQMTADADIAFINQETPMCGAEYGYSNYPQFNTPQQMGHDLITLGFDVLCFANNHMADMRAAGLDDMIKFTDTLDCMILGLYRNEEDYDNIRVYEQDGVKIAFLAYTYGTNIYGTKTQPTDAYELYIPVIDRDTITRQVKKAHTVADFIIVSMHWGRENTSKVSDYQREYAQLLADLGTDVILGHHPHTVQPVEWIEGSDGGRTLCYFSLGNGINCQDYLKNMVGICATFEIVKEDGKEAYVDSASCIPVFNYQSYAYKNVRLILLSELTDSLAESHHCNKTDRKVTVEGARALITDVIDAEFLPDYLK